MRAPGTHAQTPLEYAVAVARIAGRPRAVGSWGQVLGTLSRAPVSWKAT